MGPIADADIDAIPGWFYALDRDVFRVLLAASKTLGGDLAELGVYFGASAVLIGSALQPGEAFTVVDLFEDEAEDAANAAEKALWHASLTRAGFERTYRDLLGALPVIIQGPSQTIVDHARHGTHRFVHIDASHQFDHVVEDIAASKLLLKPDGIVVLDDIRHEEYPGVAAAAWQEVTGSGLKPFAITRDKLYATWGDPRPWRNALLTWAVTRPKAHEMLSVNGVEMIRLFEATKPTILLPERKPHPLKRYVPMVMWPALGRLRSRFGSASDPHRERKQKLAGQSPI